MRYLCRPEGSFQGEGERGIIVSFPVCFRKGYKQARYQTCAAEI